MSRIPEAESDIIPEKAKYLAAKLGADRSRPSGLELFDGQSRPPEAELPP